MSKYKVIFGDHEQIVEAWKFEIEEGIAMFYDNRGELVASFIGYSAVVKEQCPTKP